MVAEIARESRVGFEVLLENFVSLPKPEYVTLFGAAENAPGPLANVAEQEANNRHYRVLVQFPQVRLYENKVEWTVSYAGEVTIEGQVTPASIFSDNRLIGSQRNRIVNDNNEFVYGGQISRAALFADKPITGNKEGRVQLCPTEPWAISFKFPGPVDSKTAWQVLVPSTKIMGMSVRKTKLSGKKDESHGNQFKISDFDVWLIWFHDLDI